MIGYIAYVPRRFRRIISAVPLPDRSPTLCIIAGLARRRCLSAKKITSCGQCYQNFSCR
jgi:hypothetical protein